MLTVSPLRTAAADDVERFREIYEASFPASEREDTGALLEGIAAGDLESLVAATDGKVNGIAVWQLLETAPFCYLQYLAVAPAERGSGIGAELLREVSGRCAGPPDGRQGVIFEVDPPYAAAGEERGIRQRRIAFYERNGAYVLAQAPLYKAPRLDDAGILPFTLMLLPIHSGGQSLGGDALRRVARAILVESYELDEQSSLVQSVLADILD